eukprot:6227001-Amphidinium_carterae.1
MWHLGNEEAKTTGCRLARSSNRGLYAVQTSQWLKLRVDFSEQMSYHHKHGVVKRYMHNMQLAAGAERQLLIGFDETVLGEEPTLFGFVQFL